MAMLVGSRCGSGSDREKMSRMAASQTSKTVRRMREERRTERERERVEVWEKVCVVSQCVVNARANEERWEVADDHTAVCLDTVAAAAAAQLTADGHSWQLQPVDVRTYGANGGEREEMTVKTLYSYFENCLAWGTDCKLSTYSHTHKHTPMHLTDCDQQHYHHLNRWWPSSPYTACYSAPNHCTVALWLPLHCLICSVWAQCSVWQRHTANGGSGALKNISTAAVSCWISISSGSWHWESLLARVLCV